ncbi:MAG: nucleoside recognition domain-containing protein [Bacilli bacterium]
MINKIWAYLIIIPIIFYIMSNNLEGLNKEIIESGSSALSLIMKIFPLMALWTGLMEIAKQSGLMEKCAQLLNPVLSKLFPEIPKNHESLSLIASNVIVNIFGLGSAATPFGLKAMKSLQKLNKNKNEASRSMCTFIILNTSGVTLIPTTVIALRTSFGSSNPTATVFISIIVTTQASIFALILDRLHYIRRNK